MTQTTVKSLVSTVPEAEALACDLSAMTPDQRQRHEQAFEKLNSIRQSVLELPDGYAWQFPGDTDTGFVVAEFMLMEHLCCPFFRFTLEVEPGHGSIWLRFTGSEQVKEFLDVQTSFGNSAVD